MSNLGNKEVLSKNLTFYVERSGKTQKELAEILGVKYSTFNDWMKAKKYPRIDKIEMLANYFGIMKSDLIEEKSATTEDDGLTEEQREVREAIMTLEDPALQRQVLEYIEFLKSKRNL